MEGTGVRAWSCPCARALAMAGGQRRVTSLRYKDAHECFVSGASTFVFVRKQGMPGDFD